MASYSRTLTMSAVLVLTFAILVQAKTSIPYINGKQIPAYSSLSQCVMEPLSEIVRDMKSGCGDGGQYTSFDCFCSSSSTSYNWIIASAVSAECSATAGADRQVSSALDIFHSYCQLPMLAAAATSSPSTMMTMTSSEATQIAAPGAGAAAAGPLNTSPASADNNSSSKDDSGMTTSAIVGVAVGVSIGVIVILGLGIAYFWMTRRSHGREQDSPGVDFVPIYMEKSGTKRIESQSLNEEPVSPESLTGPRAGMTKHSKGPSDMTDGTAPISRSNTLDGSLLDVPERRERRRTPMVEVPAKHGRCATPLVEVENNERHEMATSRSWRTESPMKYEYKPLPKLPAKRPPRPPPPPAHLRPF